MLSIHQPIQKNKTIINERILNNSTLIISKLNGTEYSLNQGYFDPIASSPPNHFMEKLEKRIHSYTKGSNQIK